MDQQQAHDFMSQEIVARAVEQIASGAAEPMRAMRDGGAAALGGNNGPTGENGMWMLASEVPTAWLPLDENGMPIPIVNDPELSGGNYVFVRYWVAGSVPGTAPIRPIGS